MNGIENNIETVNSENESAIDKSTVFRAPDTASIPVIESKKSVSSQIGKTIVIACLICALVGGAVGGIISAFIVGSAKQKTAASENNSAVASQGIADKVAADTDNKDSDGQPAAENTTAPVVQSGQPTTSSAPASGKLTAKEVYERNVNSVVSIEAKKYNGTGYGTGFVINKSGYIVTNYHVVSGASSLNIAMHDDSQYKGTVVGYEESNDIAVVKITPDGDIDCVDYGISSNLKVGDPIFIIGNPLGDLTFTLTTGVVSALNRLIKGEDGLSINMFQTDAAVNNGNSGGPVFNEYGKVVGIASAKYAASSIEGLGFCIPIDDVCSMINEIISKGYVSGKPLMGVSVYDKVISSYGFIQSTRNINGAKVAAVGNNSAAVNSGIKVDDVIVAVDGEAVDSVSALKTILTSHRSGDTVKLTVYRGTSEMTLTMKFDEYEPADPRTNYSNVYDL